MKKKIPKRRLPFREENKQVPGPQPGVSNPACLPAVLCAVVGGWRGEGGGEQGSLLCSGLGAHSTGEETETSEKCRARLVLETMLPLSSLKKYNLAAAMGNAKVTLSLGSP